MGDASRRVITVGRWLQLVDTWGWDVPHAWHFVHESAVAALPKPSRWLRPGESHDLVQELLLLATDPPDTWRRPEIADVPLVAWFAGVMHALHLAERDAALDSLGDREPVAADDPNRPSWTEARRRRIRGTRRLTAKQSAAWALDLGNAGQRAAAAQLDITRRAYRDRLDRSRRRVLARTTRAPPPAHSAPQSSQSSPDTSPLVEKLATRRSS